MCLKERWPIVPISRDRLWVYALANFFLKGQRINISDSVVQEAKLKVLFKFFYNYLKGENHPYLLGYN